jgi:hypothetical protein
MEATLSNDPAASFSHPSFLRNLTLIYLALAYEADQDLGEAEFEAITTKIGEWVPDADDQDVAAIVREARTTYVQSPNRRIFPAAVEEVGRAVPESQQKSLLADLRHLAEVDSDVRDSERRIIRDLSRAWGLDE